jgi:L-lactate dehydrogenase complex protein LldE
MPAPETAPRVGLFVTCLVDLFRPSVGFAAVRLLQDAGCEVEVPLTQTCCGQPAYNNGDERNARAIARQVIRIFSAYDYVVAPSGSCAAMIKVHYPQLLHDDPDWRDKALLLSGRTHELMSFLHEVRHYRPQGAALEAAATYHDSCSGLRELGIHGQPRELLRCVRGLALKEMNGNDNCCGFGGTFCVKYPEISARIADDKGRDIEQSGAGILLGGDLGCLMHIAGRLQRLNIPVRCYHAAEMLAGTVAHAAIGEPD